MNCRNYRFTFAIMSGQQATVDIVLVVLSLVTLLMTLVCFGLVVTNLLRHGEVFAAAISIICLPLGGLGLLVALAYGWGKAREWRIRRLMMAYSLSLVLSFILLVVLSSLLDFCGPPPHRSAFPSTHRADQVPLNRQRIVPLPGGTR